MSIAAAILQSGDDLRELILAVVALIGCVSVGTVAYRWPLFTIAAVAISAQVLDHEATAMLPASRRLLLYAPLQLRYFDPVLVGIGAATMFRFVVGRARLSRAALRTYALLAALFLWFGLIVLRSMPRYGTVEALGEFRAYYAHLLLVPYIYVSFRTPERQWKLFRLLLALSLFFIPFAVFRGYLQRGWEIGPQSRWLSAFGNLALVLGAAGLIVGAKFGQIRLRMATFLAICTIAAALTLTNGHRSVWLWLACVGVVMLLRRTASLKRVMQLVLGLLLVVLLAQPWLGQQGLGMTEYVNERLTAFRDFSADDNSAWRYYLWLQAIERIRASPIAGLGFGGNFHLYGRWGEVISTSPHNLYITIAYHAGVVALAIYVGFCTQAFIGIMRALRLTDRTRERVILETGLLALLAGGAFYVAYTFEYFTWMYVGLAVATAVSVQTARARPTRQPAIPRNGVKSPLRLAGAGARRDDWEKSALELPSPPPIADPD